MSDLIGYNRVSAEDRTALIALCVEYSWRVDNHRTETVAELFVDDGVWEAGTNVMIGKAELVAGWKARATIGEKLTRRHQLCNFRFLRTADGVMHGWHGLIYFQTERGTAGSSTPTMIGDYEDTYGKATDGTWLFKTRKMTPVFPGGWSPATPTP